MRLSGAMEADQRVAVAAFVEEREVEVEGIPAIALRHHDRAGREHGGQDGRQPRTEPVCQPARGIEEDEIVLACGRGCAAEEPQRVLAADLGLGPQGPEVGLERAYGAWGRVDERGRVRATRE